MPPRISRRVSLVAGLALLLIAPLALASGPVFKWVDDSGHAQYGDRPPAHASRVPVEESEADPGALAGIEEVPNGTGVDVYISNHLAGPLEINLALLKAMNVQSLPTMRLPQVLPPRQRVLVSRLEYGAGQVSYVPNVNVVPGDPKAFPDDTAYSLPLADNSGWQLGQAFHGGFSHTDEQNRYAVDLIVPEGTPILAARGGTVMQVESAFARSGLDAKKFAERANLVRILHEDGTMAVYAHLQANGVYVRVGQKVSLGQQIGVSGNTGYSSGPHLHFCLQINSGMKLVSIPFRMVGPAGFLDLPKK
jgi:murein DD-endopeptidase MepM/ murein hydrolase activator NlpD